MTKMKYKIAKKIPLSSVTLRDLESRTRSRVSLPSALCISCLKPLRFLEVGSNKTTNIQKEHWITVTRNMLH